MNSPEARQRHRLQSVLRPLLEPVERRFGVQLSYRTEEEANICLNWELNSLCDKFALPRYCFACLQETHLAWVKINCRKCHQTWWISDLFKEGIRWILIILLVLLLGRILFSCMTRSSPDRPGAFVTQKEKGAIVGEWLKKKGHSGSLDPLCLGSQL